MYLMKTGSLPLAHTAGFIGLFTRVANNPVLGILIAAAFTAIVQSSAAALGVAIAIASQTVAAGGGSAESVALSLKLAAPVVIGANLGTCSTAFIASAATGRKGRQVAVAHLVVKLIGAIIVIPLLGPFTDAVVAVTKWMTGATPVGREIANAHTIIAVGTGVIVLPFTRSFSALVRRIVKVPAEERPAGFGGKLDLALVRSPELALARARAEVQRCAQATSQMFDLGGQALLNENTAALEKSRRADNAVDLSTAAVTDYLSRLPGDQLSEAETARRNAVLYIIWDLEYIGDLVSKDLAQLTEELLTSGGEMSIEAITQLRQFWADVGADFVPLIEALGSGDGTGCQRIIDHESRIEVARRHLHDAYLDRVIRGVGETRESSVVYMDAVVALRQVHYYLADAARNLTAQS
jgi:phosphate:Na+ symporter